MDVAPELIYAVIGALGVVITTLAAAVAWQGRLMVKNHQKCEANSAALSKRVQDLSDKQEKLLVTVIRENTNSNHAVIRYIRKLGASAKKSDISFDVDSESDLLPSVREGYEAHVVEKNEIDTTVVIRKKAHA